MALSVAHIPDYRVHQVTTLTASASGTILQVVNNFTTGKLAYSVAAVSLCPVSVSNLLVSSIVGLGVAVLRVGAEG